MSNDTDRQLAPVLMVGFNRPQFMEEVFEQVRKAQPSRLYVALDHPRDGRADDIPGWTACQKIFERVDWPCEVQYNFAPKNMGCRKRIESAISWALSHEDRIIILEDDCVPSLDFFRFASEMLERYKDDPRIGMVGGHDEHLHVDRLNVGGASYYFDRFTSIWGWGTWRRAWNLHDPALSYWPEMKASGCLHDIMLEQPSFDLWNIHFEGVYSGGVDTWDTGWFLTALKQNWLTIHPTVNLVSNIGVGSSSRNGTKSDPGNSPWYRRPWGVMAFPLQHPCCMMPNVLSEYYARQMHLGSRFRRFLRSLSKGKWQFLGLFGVAKKKK